MARDPDTPSIAVIKETRGRRTKSLRIRDSVRQMEGIASTLKAAPKALGLVGEVGVFAYLVWATRVVYVAQEGTVRATVTAGGRTFDVIPTFRKRDVASIQVTHPDAGTSELLGMILLLTNLPSGGILEIIEDAAVLVMYHSLFNGFDFTFPPQLQPTAGLFSLAWPFDLLGTIATYVGGTGGATSPGASTAKISMPGLFRQSSIGATDLGKWAIAKAARGEVPLPIVGATAVRVPIDGDVLRIFTLPKVLASLAHAGFMHAYLKRGLPTIGGEGP